MEIPEPAYQQPTRQVSRRWVRASRVFWRHFNPRRLPGDVGELGNHGIQQLNKLCHHFKTVLDSGRCKNQFLRFKHLVRSFRAMNFEQFTSTLIQEYKHVHPDFVQLALTSLIIPVSSAPWERGFSVQNSIKTKLRNRLNPEWLNRMMMVKLVGPHFEDVDFLTAARAFRAMKTRQKWKVLKLLNCFLNLAPCFGKRCYW